MIATAIKLQTLWWYQRVQIQLYILSINTYICLMLVVIAAIIGYNYWLFS